MLIRGSFFGGVAAAAFAILFQGLRNMGQTNRLVESLGFQLHVSPNDILVLSISLFLMCLAADAYSRYAPKSVGR